MIKRLLVLIFLMAMTVTAQAQSDSLGIERKGDQVLVLHKVKSGQTLYSLARRYGASVKAIRDENGGLPTGLKVGQTLKIPYTKEVIVPKAVAVVTGAKTHKVAKGETLFSISRQYGLKVDELKRLNKMTSNGLSLGQDLIVSAGKPVEITKPKEVEETVKTDVTEKVDEAKEAVTNGKENLEAKETAVTETVEEVTQEVADSVKTVVKEEKEIPVNYGGTTLEETTEEGIAELIVEDEPSKKFLALHKTAKVGTVIKIRNLTNDLTVYVRVVGQIPDTSDNENILIKINKRAHDQLKALDPRFRAKLSYFQ